MGNSQRRMVQIARLCLVALLVSGCGKREEPVAKKAEEEEEPDVLKPKVLKVAVASPAPFRVPKKFWNNALLGFARIR